MLRVGLIVAGCIFWAVLHNCSLSIVRFVCSQSGDPDLASKGADRLALLSGSRATHMRKLVRSQLYCVFAAALGPSGWWETLGT